MLSACRRFLTTILKPKCRHHQCQMHRSICRSDCSSSLGCVWRTWCHMSATSQWNHRLEHMTSYECDVAVDSKPQRHPFSTMVVEIFQKGPHQLFQTGTTVALKRLFASGDDRLASLQRIEPNYPPFKLREAPALTWLRKMSILLSNRVSACHITTPSS